jgi:hypothetical protein
MHDSPSDPTYLQLEPARLAEITRWLLAVLVGAGWLTLNDTTTNWIVSAVGLVASGVLTYWTRHQVTPVAEPRDANGIPLAGPPLASSSIL